jgi:hypothetical protein
MFMVKFEKMVEPFSPKSSSNELKGVLTAHLSSLNRGCIVFPVAKTIMNSLLLPNRFQTGGLTESHEKFNEDFP